MEPRLIFRLPGLVSGPAQAAFAAAGLIAVFAMVGCSDPAEGVVEATVTDAKPESPAARPGAAPARQGQRYEFAPTSRIEFTGSAANGPQNGRFEKFSGWFSVADGKPVGADHRVEIDMNSVQTDHQKLTDHLKNTDFFDAPAFPTAVFDEITLTPGEGDTWTVAGNLTLHGQTKAISFPATVTREGDTVAVKSEFSLNRRDFAIDFEGASDNLIRDEVVIRLDLLAAPQN